jgi:ATP-dependent helicase/DNAse subunit B
VQRQAEDPFSAFATSRLGVAELDALEHGLSARHRGTVLHRALHVLLADLPSRMTLSAWSDSERATRIDRAVDTALGELRRHANPVLQRLLDIEKRRMQKLLYGFLAGEQDREDFTVLGVEQKAALQFGDLSLHLRIDRTDRLADGSVLIIDYKSGSVRNLQKQGGEPANLQMCVYAKALQDPVGGLVYINIDSREISYKGVGGSVPWGRISAAEWPSTLATWVSLVDVALTQLADGDVRVNTQLQRDKTRPLGILSRIEEIKRVC